MVDASGAGVTRGRVLLAFAAIYVFWGSTYLAILYAIETMPPFLMAGVRFVVAGAILYAWSWLRGTPRPERVHWRSATVVGGLLLLGGNGSVVWAEQRVASGLAALLVATVPVWMVLLDWLRPGGVRPGPRVVAGIVVGLLGLAVLVGPDQLMGAGRVDGLGALVLVLGSVCWATGSLYARSAKVPASPIQAIAIEMLAGGALLLLAGVIVGEPARLDLGAVSVRSLVALGYLIVFGSLIGFSAYIWLLNVSTPAKVSTYAYVNPVVAVLLGWGLAGEPLTPRMMAAAAIIVAGVAVITTRRAARGRPAMERPETACARVPSDTADPHAAAAAAADQAPGPGAPRAMGVGGEPTTDPSTA